MTSTENLSYEDACAVHATRQGLDPITARLTAERIVHFVQQTGGMTMVVTVPVGDRAVCVTRDGLDPERPYLVGEYTSQAWADGEESDADHFNQTLDEVVEIIRAAQLDVTMRQQIASAVPCGECGEIGHDAADHRPLALVDYSPTLLTVLVAAHERGDHDPR